MERHELAEKCMRIDKIGDSVREYLKTLGHVSPWGTWYRLQIEELGRKSTEVTDGRGRGDMKRLTREEKLGAVRIAMDGASAMAYLSEHRCKNPTATWINIKQMLRETDPEIYRELTEKKPEESLEDQTETCKQHEPKAADHPEKPEMVDVESIEKPEDTQGRQEAHAEVPEMHTARQIDGFGITGLRTGYGEFHVSNNGYLHFGANDHDELEMPLDIWRQFAVDLPKIFKNLGI